MRGLHECVVRGDSPQTHGQLGSGTRLGLLSVTHFTALFDACVLSPAELRSLLMYLALTDLFRVRWTERIHEE